MFLILDRILIDPDYFVLDVLADIHLIAGRQSAAGRCNAPHVDSKDVADRRSSINLVSAHVEPHFMKFHVDQIPIPNALHLNVEPPQAGIFPAV
jgi:hypothetical protein